MHKRQEIREAIKTMLLGNTDAGANVYSNRVSAFWKSELPSISIVTTEEEANPRDLGNKTFVRKLRIGIEVHAEATEKLDDVLDDISNQIEALIGADQSLTGTVLGTVMTGTTIELAGEATTPIGVLSISFTTTYIK